MPSTAFVTGWLAREFSGPLLLAGGASPCGSDCSSTVHLHRRALDSAEKGPSERPGDPPRRNSSFVPQTHLWASLGRVGGKFGRRWGSGRASFSFRFCRNPLYRISRCFSWGPRWWFMWWFKWHNHHATLRKWWQSTKITTLKER